MKLVSVIITTYGNPINLERSINSVLNQTYSNFEIIIVDDNNDNTIERRNTEQIVCKYKDNRIKYIKHNKNLNGAVARNTGIMISKGEYISFLDNDDLYLPQRLEKCLEILEEYKQIYDIVYTNTVYIVAKSIVDTMEVRKTDNPTKELLLNECFLGTGSNIFIRASLCKELKGFDERFCRHQDIEFMLRAIQSHKIYPLMKNLVVKDITKSSNIPKYKGLYIAKQLYFKKFKYLIEYLTDEEKNMFYNYHYTILLNSAISGNDNYEITCAINNIEKFRKLNKKETMLIKHKNIRMLTQRIKRLIKSTYSLYYVATKIKNLLTRREQIAKKKIGNLEYINLKKII